MKTHLAALALAIAAFTSSTVATTTSFDASFDTLTTLPGEGLTTPVGVYKNLNFSSFFVNSPAAGVTLIGVNYHSKANVAFATLGTLTTDVPTVSTSYAGSKVKSFSVKSFYYGCYEQAGQGEVFPPVKCTLTVAGYKAGASSPFVSQNFQFTPQNVLESAPTLGTFSSSFSGLQHITFTGSPNINIGFIIDDLVGSTVS